MNSWWDLFIGVCIKMGMPFVLIYFSICSSPFLNVSYQDSQGIEKIADTLLAPFQYCFIGKVAVPTEIDGQIHYVLEDRFSYEDYFFLKSAGSMVSLIPSIVIGSTIKAVSFLHSDNYKRYKEIVASINSRKIIPNHRSYIELGLDITSPEFTNPLECQNYKRRPKDIYHLKAEKEALKEMVKIFNKYNILFWVDCGTLLGTYRYGGMIPWDHDIDISVLQMDFDNVLKVLKDLDPEKYIALDWSCRGKPKSLIKVYIKETQRMIDVYQFVINKEKRTLNFIFSFDDHMFCAEWWKDRERRFTQPVSYDTIFPLRKANFDGIEVFAPNKTVDYLHTFYGENIEPSMLYNEETCQYEKDLDHPYWKM